MGLSEQVTRLEGKEGTEEVRTLEGAGRAHLSLRKPGSLAMRMVEAEAVRGEPERLRTAGLEPPVLFS
jgi:hypothetical protein